MSGQTIKLIEDLPKQLDKTTLASSGSQLPKSASLGVFGIPGLCAHLALTKGHHPMSSQINWGVSEYSNDVPKFHKLGILENLCTKGDVFKNKINGLK